MSAKEILGGGAVIGLLAFFAAPQADRNSAGEIVSEGTVDIFQIQIGDCFDDAPSVQMDETVELTGSATAQYAEWRRLLRTIYVSETGVLPTIESQPASYVDDDPVPGASAPQRQSTPALPVQGGCETGSASPC